MGTQLTPSPPSPGGGGVSEGFAGTLSDDHNFTFPQNGYVDKVHVYTAANSGTANLKAVVYRTDTGAIVATSSALAVGTGKAWRTFTLPSFLRLTSGYGWAVGLFTDSSMNSGLNTGVGNYWYGGSGSVPSSRFSGTEDNFGNAGQMYYYLEYWPDLNITSVDAGPVAVGQTFQVHGRSFQSGGVSVLLNGVNCPTFSVDSDTQLTVTVPSGASTGVVHVSSNAGSADSSTTVTVSQAYSDSAAAWAAGVLIKADNGAAFVDGTTVWADNGTSWVQIG